MSKEWIMTELDTEVNQVGTPNLKFGRFHINRKSTLPLLPNHEWKWLMTEMNLKIHFSSSSLL